MVLVILAGEDCHQSMIEAMLLGHNEIKAIKQLAESAPLLMSRFDIEVGVGLLAIQSSGLFEKGRVAPWENGYSLDSRFKEKSLKKGKLLGRNCAHRVRVIQSSGKKEV